MPMESKIKNDHQFHVLTLRSLNRTFVTLDMIATICCMLSYWSTLLIVNEHIQGRIQNQISKNCPRILKKIASHLLRILLNSGKFGVKSWYVVSLDIAINSNINIISSIRKMRMNVVIYWIFIHSACLWKARVFNSIK